MRKFLAYSVMSLAVCAVTAFGDSSAVNEKVDQTTAATAHHDEGEKAPVAEMTLDELAKFDGTGGKPAYVAVDGIIYDVTKVKAWKKGKHKGNTAGKDLTDIITKKSPHGLKVLKKLPVVAKVKTE